MIRRRVDERRGRAHGAGELVGENATHPHVGTSAADQVEVDRVAEAGADRARHELGEHDGIAAGKRASVGCIRGSGETGASSQRVQARVVENVE